MRPSFNLSVIHSIGWSSSRTVFWKSNVEHWRWMTSWLFGLEIVSSGVLAYAPPRKRSQECDMLHLETNIHVNNNSKQIILQYIIVIINFKLKTGKGVKCTSPTFHFYDICSKYSCCLMMFSSCPWQSAKTGTKRKNSCLALVVPNIINVEGILNVKEISAFCWKAYLVVTSQLELELNIFDINS